MGVSHRCIEPHNIILIDEDKLKLIDFGVEKSAEQGRIVQIENGENSREDEENYRENGESREMEKIHVIFGENYNYY